MMVNPQWLKSFATLAELGNFTRTADRLGLTQAAVSQHVRHLEELYGSLLIRRPRALELTPAGAALLEYCAEVNQAHERLASRLSDADATQGEVALITPGSIGLFIYPMLLDLQQEHPGLAVRHRFAPDTEVLDAVLHNRYELGIVTLKPDDTRLTATPFIEEPLELVIPPGEEVHSWDDLVRIGFIDHAEGQAMANRLLSRRFPGNPGAFHLPRRGFSNQIGMLHEPVARGLGFTVVPRFAREAWERTRPVNVAECGPPVVDTLWWIHRAEWPLSARATGVIRYLRQRIEAACGSMVCLLPPEL